MGWNITAEHKARMSAFFTGFWEIVKESFEAPDVGDPGSDRYWTTLIQRCDGLMNRFNDPMVNRLVMAYLDAQSCKQCPERGDSHE